MNSREYNVLHMPLDVLTPLRIQPDASLVGVNDAVMAYQAARGLAADGFCGPATIRACLEEMTGMPMPAPPFKAPVGYDGIHARFGNPLLEKGDHGDFLKVTSPAYKAALKRVTLTGACHATVREEIADHTRNTFQWLLDALQWAPHRVDSFVPRYKRNGSAYPSPSMHSYGLALDIDPLTNGRGDQTPEIPQVVFLALFACGWNCGNWWKGSSRDAMHIQFSTGC